MRVIASRGMRSGVGHQCASPPSFTDRHVPPLRSEGCMAGTPLRSVTTESIAAMRKTVRVCQIDCTVVFDVTDTTEESRNVGADAHIETRSKGHFDAISLARRPRIAGRSRTCVAGLGCSLSLE